MSIVYSFFSTALLEWFDQHGRHDLPWQVADDPYKVWVSEIMLQQTQVKTVLTYFPKFIERFPTVNTLANATWEEVSPYWAGLGYYARARNLHKASQIVAQQGRFPQTLEEWQALPGIGRSTAGALMSLGLRQYGVILDGNVKRVLARFFAIDDDLTKSVYEKELWKLAENLCPVERNHDYTQAIMDLGATICTPKKALCLFCPLHTQCKAYQQDLVDELPVKKSKKPIPIKPADVVIFVYNQRWFWQLRPTQGLWGGLWSLPILPDPLLTYSFQLEDVKTHPRFVYRPCHVQLSHTFSHFTWQFTVHYVDVYDLEDWQALNLMNGEWLELQQIQQKAIPTAMKKLISALQSAEGDQQ